MSVTNGVKGNGADRTGAPDITLILATEAHTLPVVNWRHCGTLRAGLVKELWWRSTGATKGLGGFDVMTRTLWGLRGHDRTLRMMTWLPSRLLAMWSCAVGSWDTRLLLNVALVCGRSWLPLISLLLILLRRLLRGIDLGRLVVLWRLLLVRLVLLLTELLLTRVAELLLQRLIRLHKLSGLHLPLMLMLRVLRLELTLAKLSIGLLSLRWRWLLSILYLLRRLIPLGLKTLVYSWLCIFKLLVPALQRRMTSLLPGWNVWRGRNIDSRYWVRIRRHIGLHTLTSKRRGNICRLLFVRAHDSTLWRLSCSW